jgi:hypothetical protein
MAARYRPVLSRWRLRCILVGALLLLAGCAMPPARHEPRNDYRLVGYVAGWEKFPRMYWEQSQDPDGQLLGVLAGALQ